MRVLFSLLLLPLLLHRSNINSYIQYHIRCTIWFGLFSCQWICKLLVSVFYYMLRFLLLLFVWNVYLKLLLIENGRQSAQYTTIYILYYIYNIDGNKEWHNVLHSMNFTYWGNDIVAVRCFRHRQTLLLLLLLLVVVLLLVLVMPVSSVVF